MSTGIEWSRMRLGDADDSGRRRPVPIEGQRVRRRLRHGPAGHRPGGLAGAGRRDSSCRREQDASLPTWPRSRTSARGRVRRRRRGQRRRHRDRGHRRTASGRRSPSTATWAARACCPRRQRQPAPRHRRGIGAGQVPRSKSRCCPWPSGWAISARSSAASPAEAACAEASRCLRCDLEKLRSDGIDSRGRSMSEFTFTLDGRTVAAARGPDHPPGRRRPTALPSPISATIRASRPRARAASAWSRSRARRACTPPARGWPRPAWPCAPTPRRSCASRKMHPRIAAERAPRGLHHLRRRRRLPAAGLRLPSTRRGREAVPLGRADRRREGAYTAGHKGIVYDPSKCVRCQRCVKICAEVEMAEALTLKGRAHGRAGQHGLRPAAERIHLRDLRPVREHLPHRRPVGTRGDGPRPRQGPREGPHHLPLLRRRLPVRPATSTRRRTASCGSRPSRAACPTTATRASRDASASSSFTRRSGSPSR